MNLGSEAEARDWFAGAFGCDAATLGKLNA